MRLLGSPKRIILILLSLIPLVLCALVVWGISLAAPPAPVGPRAHDLMFVPDYPSAQQVQVMTTTVRPFDPYNPYKTVKFDTTDSPDHVFAFYKDALRHRYYEDWGVDDARETFASLHVFGFDQSDISPIMFQFDVKTTQSGNLTHVTVELSYVPGM